MSVGVARRGWGCPAPQARGGRYPLRRACATEQHCHGKDVGVPRADRVKLNAAGLDMPSVDHMSNNSSLNVVVDRILWIGRPAAKL